jgi:formylglycine-generating enzyme required for sulfatase activity/ferredoxin
MAERNDKHSENIFGAYYVDTSCIDCDLCRATAPNLFGRADDGISIVTKQPSDETENTLAREALKGCPVEAIGDDGLQGGSTVRSSSPASEARTAARRAADEAAEAEKEEKARIEWQKAEEEGEKKWLNRRREAKARIEAASHQLTSSEWDVFLSHASEDKPFARQLVEALENWGVRVWFDEHILQPGDSLRRKIDAGLANSSYGIVVISETFLSKEWPQRELDGLFAREVGNAKVLIPIWHEISASKLRKVSPSLADRMSILSNGCVDVVAEKIVVAILKDQFGKLDWNPLYFRLPDESEVAIMPIHPYNGMAIGVGRTVITNEQFSRFVNETHADPPVGEHFHDEQWQGPFVPWNTDTHNLPSQPVTCVNYRDAQAYCKWVTLRMNPDVESTEATIVFDDYSFARIPRSRPIVSLPSTLLWDFAAYGRVLSKSTKRRLAFDLVQRAVQPQTRPAQVGRENHSANEHGIYDLFGNVWQWCSQPYLGEDVSSYYSFGGRTRRFDDPQLRGGGFLDDITKIRVDLSASILPDGPITRRSDIGFRIACLLPVEILPNRDRAMLTVQERMPTDFWKIMTG